MAYYDLKTNEIWADSNIAGFHDEHIEIDEVIAPLIRELNIKGYKTKFCCSGHPFYSLCEAMVDSEETAKAFVGLIGTERTENPRVKSLPDSMTLLHSIPILLLNGLTEIFRCCLQW